MRKTGKMIECLLSPVRRANHSLQHNWMETIITINYIFPDFQSTVDWMLFLFRSINWKRAKATIHPSSSTFISKNQLIQSFVAHSNIRIRRIEVSTLFMLFIPIFVFQKSKYIMKLHLTQINNNKTKNNQVHTT